MNYLLEDKKDFWRRSQHWIEEIKGKKVSISNFKRKRQNPQDASIKQLERELCFPDGKKKKKINLLEKKIGSQDLF